MKELRCRDAGFDCDTVLRGESQEDLFAQAAPHAREVHGIEVTPERADRLRTLVRDA